MPFVRRDPAGSIVGVSESTTQGFTEEVASHSAEMIHFLDKIRPRPESLERTDQGFVRVLEDVIDLLVEKDLIKLNELPQDAQGKLSTRRQLRKIPPGD